jgi:hypothetical protein
MKTNRFWPSPCIEEHAVVLVRRVRKKNLKYSTQVELCHDMKLIAKFLSGRIISVETN